MPNNKLLATVVCAAILSATQELSAFGLGDVVGAVGSTVGSAAGAVASSVSGNNVANSTAAANSGTNGSQTIANAGDALKKSVGYYNMATKSLDDAIDFSFKLIGTSEQKAEIERQMDAANKTEDPKEKQAKIEEIKKLKAEYVESANKANEIEKVKLNKEQQKQFVAVWGNVLLAVLQDKIALELGKAAISAVRSNPVQAVFLVGELGAGAEMIKSIPTQLSQSAQIIKNFSKLAKNNKIPEPKQPTSVDAKPVEVAI